MMDLIRELWIVLRKELLYIFRVPDVLIFSVLIPMVLYPSLLVGGAGLALWQAHHKSEYVYKIAVPETKGAEMTWLINGLEESKLFHFLPDTDADERLTTGGIDAQLSMKSGSPIVQVHYNETKLRSSDAVEKIRDTVEKLSKERIKSTLSAHGLPTKDLRAFQVKIRDINDMAEGENSDTTKKDESLVPLLRYGLLFAVFFLITNARSAAVSPAVFVLAQERDRKTLQSTLALPVNRNILIIAKALTVVLMSTLSVVVNAIGVVILVILIFASLAARTHGQSPTAMAMLGGINLAHMMTILISTCLDIFLSSCLLLLVCCLTRTTKEAQALLIIVSLLMVCVSVVALIPSMSLNTGNAFIPLLNLMLVIKAAAKGTASALPVFITFAETLLLIYGAVYFTSYKLRQESFVLGAQTRWPWQSKLNRSRS